MHTALAIGLFVVVLALVIIQPRGLSIGWTAAVGGTLALVLHIVSWANVGEVIGIVWDATLTFVAVILISLILDAAGFFEWAALWMARASRGRGIRLFLLLGILGAMVAMFFANDGAALILTPIMIAEIRALGFGSRATIALVMTSGFIADTTSLPLVVSNLVNIVSADFFHLGFIHFMVRMLPVDIVALGASLTVLYWFYRRDLPRTAEVNALKAPEEAIRDPKVFRVSWIILALLLGGYFLSQILHWPVSLFAGSAALVFLAVSYRSPNIPVKRLVLEAPWKVVVFSIGMYVVVFGLRNAGLTHLLSEVLSALASHNTFWATIGTGFIAAILSSVMNNMPTVMIGALAIHQAVVHANVRHLMAYANVIGCDLGPKFTPIGSLATLLWLNVLERRDIRISWGYYMRVGLTLTVPVLLVTLVALWGWSWVMLR
ncbi:MAG: arsenic transporter [Firmicutes bacterium]|nr:arsenic transporter [Bacillota bacterium]